MSDIPNIDAVALETAYKIDDIFAQGHVGGRVQRTSKVQVAVIQAIQTIVDNLDVSQSPPEKQVKGLSLGEKSEFRSLRADGLNEICTICHMTNEFAKQKCTRDDCPQPRVVDERDHA